MRISDPQTDVAPSNTRGRDVRSKNQCSMCPAIHTKSRSWLRSSSTREPSDPLLRVVFLCFLKSSGISPFALRVVGDLIQRSHLSPEREKFRGSRFRFRSSRSVANGRRLEDRSVTEGILRRGAEFDAPSSSLAPPTWSAAPPAPNSRRGRGTSPKPDSERSNRSERPRRGAVRYSRSRRSPESRGPRR